MASPDAIYVAPSHLENLQSRQEKPVVVSRGVYQQPFRFESWPSRVMGCMFGFPAWVLDTLLPVMLPDSPRRICWSLWTLALVLYVAIDVPLQIAFTGWIKLPAVMALSLMTSASFCLDVVVHFRTAYITGQGDLVRVPHLIALHYLRGMFLLDLVSALPLDEIFHGASFSTDAVWLGLLKLPRLFRLARHVNALTRTKYINLVGVARLLGVMLLIAHWSACLWHFLSLKVPGIFNVITMISISVTFKHFFLVAGRGFSPYCVVTVPMRKNTPLRFTDASSSCSVSSITMLVTNMWSMESRHKQRDAMLQDALRYKGAPEEMRIRVHEYYNFMACFDHPGSDGVSLLCELPAALHAEVLSSVFERMLIKVQLFAYCERPFLWRLSQRLRLSLYMPGDVIYDVGSVGHDMYIIWKGAVGLTSPDGCMAALLCNNDHFGELGLMNVSTPRPHRAVALRRCDVMILNLWDLQDAMRDFPDSAHLVKGRARVQLEDHESGPAVWAASLATGKTPHHELHPQAPASVKQANATGPANVEENTEVVTRLASLTHQNLQLLQAANSSSERPSSLALLSPSTSSYPVAVSFRRSCSGGGGGDDDGSGGGASKAAAAADVSDSMNSLRNNASRRLRQSSSMDARRPQQTFDPDGSGGSGGGQGIGCPVAEAAERRGATAAETHGSFSLTAVTALSQPRGSPSCINTTRETIPEAIRDKGDARRINLRRAARSQTCATDECKGGIIPGQCGQPSPRLHQQHHQQQQQYHRQQQLLPGSIPESGSHQLPESCQVRGQLRRRQEEPAGPSSGGLLDAIRDSNVTAPPPPYEGPGRTQACWTNVPNDELGRDQVDRTEGDDVHLWFTAADGSSVRAPLRRVIKPTHTDSPVRICAKGGGGDSVQSRTTSNSNGNDNGRGFLNHPVPGNDGSVRALRVANDWSFHGLKPGGDGSARVFGSSGDGSRHVPNGSVRDSKGVADGSLHGFRTSGDGSIRGFKPPIDRFVCDFRALDGDSSATGFRANGDGGSMHGYSGVSVRPDSRVSFRAGSAGPNVGGRSTRSRASSTTGIDSMRDDAGQEDRDLRPPNLLVLQGQPFLGLDPLGPLFDDVATRAAAAAAAQQLRRRMHDGGYHVATTAAAAGAASGGMNLRQGSVHPHGSAAYGDHGTTRELVRPMVVWEGRKVRRSSMHVISSGPDDNCHRARLASDNGAHYQQQKSSVDTWSAEQSRIRQPSRDAARCQVLEEQLAEAQRQMDAVFQNPLQIPAFAAALRREVEAATARLNGQMVAQLRKLHAMLHTVSAYAEDLTLQVALVGDRLQRLEEEQHATGAAAVALMAAGLSNAGRTGGSRTDGPLDSHDGPDGLNSTVGSLGLLGPQAPPPVLLPLSAPNANTSGRFSMDAGRLLATRQLSMRHIRRLSALEYGTLADSEPLVDGGTPSPAIAVAAAAAAIGGPTGPDAQPLQAMTVEDAALLAATVQRAVGSTSRRRRSALELSLLSYSNLSTSPGHEVLQLLQPTQPPATRSSQGQRSGLEGTDLDNTGSGDGGDGSDGGGGAIPSATAPKQATSLLSLVEPTADGPPTVRNWRAASLRRSGRRASWVILAAQSVGAEGIAKSDPVATVHGGDGGGGGGGGSVQPEGAAGSSEPQTRPLLLGDAARHHHIANSFQRQQVSFQADGSRRYDVQNSSCVSSNDISNTGIGSGYGGGGRTSSEISVVKEDAMQQPLQLSGSGPALRRSRSSIQDRRGNGIRSGSGGGGVGNTTPTKRKFFFRRSLTSVLKEDSQRAQQPLGGPPL